MGSINPVETLMAERNDDRDRRLADRSAARPFDRLFRDEPRMAQPFGTQGFGGGAYGYGGYGDTGYSTPPEFDRRPRSAESPPRRGNERYGESRDSAFSREQDYGRSGYGDPGARERREWSMPDEERPSYGGRGPRGYQRSDERLREMICERLTDDREIDASDISIDVRDQEVVLTGTVRNRSEKYHVEEVVDRCGGVKEIRNQLKVQSSSRGDAGSGYTRPGNNAQDDR